MTPRPQSGFSLVSTLIAVAIFSMLALAAYNLEVISTKALRAYREKEDVAALADQYIEVARNLPYSQIGTISGNPHGVLPDLPNLLTVSYNDTKYQLYYDVTYVDDPADGTAASGTDPAPNDYKQVKLYVKNPVDGLMTTFLTSVVPQGLEGLASGGALSLQVINATGQPVPGASVTITNSSVSPAINVTRTTDSTGHWIEVGLPDSTNAYHIVATKGSYSSDQTYPSSVNNPNPVKPDATISNGQVTQISFSIDQQSSLTVNTVTQSCQPLPSVGVQISGTKLIGTNPNVYKFNTSYTSNGSGQVVVNPIEWDTYTPSITSASYMIYGSSPIQQINLLPGTAQQSTLVLGPSTTNSLLIIVKDAATGNPIQGASVELKSTSPSYDSTLLTAGSILYQNDWSGGSGQYDFSTTTKYAQDDGNVDTQTLPTGVRLAMIGGSYAPSGQLTSSSFDTGTASSSYTTLFWNPTSQNASTSVSFQIATNNDDQTWNYAGPDGTASTYYTVPGTTINAAQNNARYLRYRMYLSSMSTTTTPVVTNVTVNYVSGCASPGQAMFAGLSSGSNYTIVVSMPGYQTQTISNVNISGRNTLQVQLSQ
ncbi:MAG: prepilin-type N-terminal cleavage/methylation domain-containing protein [Candidatus Pacebacteria bacterium]|nr:prepilin-type N-terminal cleavage/methylation domain-containing protein [Candidatus Paceibacterota bacterium]